MSNKWTSEERAIWLHDHLRRMAQKQRELAVEFEDQADKIAARYELPAPDQGHTWRISVASRSSSKVKGEEHHQDALRFDPVPQSVEVRAWSLPEALGKASQLGLEEWFHD